jgi:hypothetical protein
VGESLEPAWQLSELEMSVRMLLSLRSKEPLMLAGAAPPRGWPPCGSAEADRSAGETEETRQGVLSRGRGEGSGCVSGEGVAEGRLDHRQPSGRSLRASLRVPSHSQMLPAPPGQPVIDSMLESQREAPAR